MRVLILWSRLSGYLVECLRQLALRHHADLFTIHWQVSANAPFNFPGLDLPGPKLLRSELRHSRDIERVVLEFDPHVALVSGWMDRMYLRSAITLRRRGCIVVGCMDNQWRASFRQVVGSLAAWKLLDFTFSALWVPGERSAQFASRLGFQGRRLWRGLYCAATTLFRSCGEERRRVYRTQGSWPRCFVFVGRYEEVKGLPELLEAYRKYRQACTDAWELVCVGHGPLKREISRSQGVLDLGFLQPWELPSILTRSGCFVLPSRREGWVVALLEAASSALPVICSDQCGSHVELVRDGFNGLVVPSHDVNAIAQAMADIAAMPPGELCLYGTRSSDLAANYTPEWWADYFVGKVLTLTSASRGTKGPVG